MPFNRQYGVSPHPKQPVPLRQSASFDVSSPTIPSPGHTSPSWGRQASKTHTDTPTNMKDVTVQNTQDHTTSAVSAACDPADVTGPVVSEHIQRHDAPAIPQDLHTDPSILGGPLSRTMLSHPGTRSINGSISQDVLRPRESRNATAGEGEEKHTGPSRAEPDVPRMVSRRSFARLLEETQRRSRSSDAVRSQPAQRHWDHLFGSDAPKSPVAAVIKPPPRTSSLFAQDMPWVATEGSSTESDLDMKAADTLDQLEELARAASTLPVIPSPIRRNFAIPERCISPCPPSSDDDASDEACSSGAPIYVLPDPTLPLSITRRTSRSIGDELYALHRPTRTHAHRPRQRPRVPEIVITVPSCEDVGASPQQQEQGESAEDEADEVRWVEEYGRWMFPGDAGDEDASMDSSDAESDVSSLFISYPFSDQSSVCTSPPTSPPADGSKVCDSITSRVWCLVYSSI